MSFPFLPTASSLERAFACPASVILPQAVGESGEHADRGIIIHAVVNGVTNGLKLEDAYEDVDDEDIRSTCEKMDVRKLVGDLTEVQGEPAYGYDPETDTAEFLGLNIGRNYPKRETPTFFGAADIIGLSFTDKPVTIDVKTGQRVTTAKDNPQIKFHALVRQRLTGAPEVEGRLAYLKSNGDVYLDSHTFDVFELDAFADELKALPARIETQRWRIEHGSAPDVQAGAWCRYCAAKPACPYYQGLARFVGADVSVMHRGLASMSPQQLGETWMKAREYERVLDTVIKGLKAIAADRPIPLPNGQTLKQIQSSRESFSQDKALALLEAYGAPAEAIAGLYMKSTFPKIQACGKARKILTAKAETLAIAMQENDE